MELFDEASGRIIEIPSKKLVLEHSLVSISKWESKWHKPYLPQPNMSKEWQQKTKEEEMDYVRCMTIGDNIDPLVYYGLTTENYKAIQNYINDPMTASSVKSKDTRPGKELITSELIYYWMTALNIPFQPCEKWHLNRLMMLIQIAAIKNQPDKKMNPKDVMRNNHSLNAARRAKHHTKG